MQTEAAFEVQDVMVQTNQPSTERNCEKAYYFQHTLCLCKWLSENF